MKRGFVVTVAGAAIVVAGLAGCSSNKSSSASQTASASNGNGTVTSGTGTAKVTIDGKDQNLQGSIVCADVPGTQNTSITIGNAAQGGGSAVVSKGDNPEVQQIGLTLNGQPLAYNKGTPGGGDAKAEKSGKEWKLSGHLTGMPDMSNPTAGPSTHEFSMDVTCP